ncbi:MAG: serine/threonine protein kinase [Kofleriaceae bacterium]|nr:serine/threonine protein kinase [Kofleriaceae bacterium]
MKRDDDQQLGSAPTTPAPEGTRPNPDSTLDMPAAERGDSRESGGGEPGPGAVIGHFVVRRKLGAGGMGVVLACEDPDLGRPVAVKLVREDVEHPAYRARLLREAQAMARLEHANVVKIYEVGTDRGRLFIAMEYVDGETLSAWLKQFRTWQDIVEMFAQAGTGLAAAHAVGLVHRDFKPDNVLVDRKGRARVADFGLARLDREGDASPMAQPLTRTGVMMGTPGYMAPEQQFGGDVDARADQYSFCVALREALGGRPVDDKRWTAVPEHVRAAIGRGLSYDADERFPSIADLLDELKRPAPRGRTRTEPRWVILLLVLAVLGSVAGVVSFISSRKSSSKRSAQVLVRDDADVPIAFAPADASPTRLEQIASVDAQAAGDASVAVAQVPIDAGVTLTTRTRRDAGHARVAALDPIDAGVAIAPVDAGTASQPQLTVIAPTTKHWPQAKVGDPSHLPVVRTAIKDLGYQGYESTWVIAELEDEIATGSRPDKAMAQVKMGMIKRRKGDCAAAETLWKDAISALKPTGETVEPEWAARAWLGLSLCSLGAGDAKESLDQMSRAWVHGNQDEVSLLMGFAKYELGEKDLAYGLLLTAERKKSLKVQTALKAWLEGQGLGLR